MLCEGSEVKQRAQVKGIALRCFNVKYILASASLLLLLEDLKTPSPTYAILNRRA